MYISEELETYRRNQVDLSTDLMISSWAKVDCYGIDFGLGLGCGAEPPMPVSNMFGTFCSKQSGSEHMFRSVRKLYR